MQQAERDPTTGRLRTRTTDARGPMSLLASAEGGCVLDDMAIVAPLDDSSEQTARVLAAERHRKLVGGGDRVAVVHRWRALLRRLDHLPVQIPFAERIDFPATSTRHRRDQRQFFALVEASALLHQHQRARIDGQVVATEDDFHHALRASVNVLGSRDDGLTDRMRSILAKMATTADKAWTLSALEKELAHLSRITLRRALEALESLDYVESPVRGRGRRARQYRVVETATGVESHGIRLLAAPASARRRSGQLDIAKSNSVSNISSVGNVRYA